VTPEQFWQLHPHELHWLFEARRPKATFGKGDGAFSEDEAEAMYTEASTSPHNKAVNDDG
jgi:hypothetical protein